MILFSIVKNFNYINYILTPNDLRIPQAEAKYLRLHFDRTTVNFEKHM